MSRAQSQPVTGPFFPIRSGERILMISFHGEGARICHKQKLKMRAAAHHRGVNINFCCRETRDYVVHAELTDALEPGRMPKKHQQDPFTTRANQVMSLAGTAHDTPEVAAMAAV